MDAGGDRPHVGHRADQIGCGCDRDEAGTRAQLGLDVLHGQFGSRGVEVHPPHDGARRGGSNHPRPDVGVVIQACHDDLVAGAPLRGQRPRQIKGERGHAPPEDHLVGIRVEQIAERKTALHDDFLGIACRGGGRSTIRQRAQHRVADGVGDDGGRLRPAGPVEVGGAVPECREALTDRLDVEPRLLGHRQSLAPGSDGRGRTVRSSPGTRAEPPSPRPSRGR